MEGVQNKKYSKVSLELGGSRSPKNAEGVQGQSWKNSEMFLEQKTGRPLTLQAFGYYCQRLPRLSTKSIHCYLNSHYFHTRFTFIALRILPLTLSFDTVPLDL